MGMIANLFVKLGLKNESFNSGLDKAQKKTNAFGSAMKKVGGLMAGAFAFGAIVKGVKTLIQTNANFEQSMASLSAITGATGKDLKFYEEQAISMGSSTTLSASEVAKAFELVGSAKPELLKSKEALAAVTQEAITLAEAAGMELPDAAKALTGAMNQFNLPASEAARVINVLAAGSKEGSADINSLNESMKNVGAVAAGAGMSVEQTVGALETLAEKQVKGAEAGTALRGVILKLQAAGVGYQSGVFNLSDAMAEANAKIKAQTSAVAKDNEMKKLFGALNITAGKIMLGNVGTYERLSKAVTGTNIAYEQQAKNTSTLKASFKGFQSAVEGLMLSFRASNGILKVVVDKITDFINKVRLAIPQIKAFLKNSDTIGIIWDGITSILAVFWNHAKNIFTNLVSIVISVVNAFIALYNESEGFRIVLATIKTAFQAAFKVGEAFLKTMSGGFKTLVDWIKSGFKGDVWKTFWNDTSKVWEDAVKEIGSDFNTNLKKAIDAEPIELVVLPELNLSKATTTGKLKIPAEKVEIKVDEPTAAIDMGGLKGTFIDVDFEAFKEATEAAEDFQADQLKKWEDFNNSMKDLQEDFAANVVTEFASGLGEMIAAGNISGQNLGLGVLKMFGDFLSQMGQMMIAFGVANSAFAASLKGLASGNPIAAGGLIAAGAALVVIGSAISSKAGSFQGGGTTSGANVSSGTYSGANIQGANQGVEEISLNAVISGDNIYLSNNRNVFKRNAIG